MKTVVLAGSPNTGKSSLFNRLSSSYAAVSNYPGTTVEVFRGRADIGSIGVDLVDSPGLYSLLPVSDEERVSRDLLLESRPDAVIHVADAKNLERGLPLTFQLVESGIPVILVLNLMDDADRLGLRVDIPLLSRRLGIPVVATVSTTGRGIDELKTALRRLLTRKHGKGRTTYFVAGRFRPVLRRLARLADRRLPVSRLNQAELMLAEDPGMMARLGPAAAVRVKKILDPVKRSNRDPLSFQRSVERGHLATEIVAECVRREIRPERKAAEVLGRLMISPWTGIPLLLLILYFGVYVFVGQFGAGTVVNWLEGHIFAHHVNPWFEKVFGVLIPWPWLRSLFTGQFGVLTLGLRYAVALILPIVTTFFLAFAVLEDSGYLPRLSLLVDRVFKSIGLSGRAVIPMVLGLGCDTMATLVTRTLATRRERLIATFLLALAIPCSAQLGVILALLSKHPAGLLVWLGVLGLVFLGVGWLGSKIVPGTPATFYMEIPPLRIPRLRNVLLKTWSRVRWYFLEILPVFLIASVLIWLGQITGVFGVMTDLLRHPVRMLGLPDQASVAFFFGFFRRDYGAAGLYDLQTSGLLDGNQIVVASVVITLFLPCIAQFLVTIKERGWKTALAIGGLTLGIAFAVGLGLRWLLFWTGVKL